MKIFLSCNRIGKIFNVNPKTIQKIVKAYNEHREESL